MPTSTRTDRRDRHSTRHAGVTRDDVIDEALRIVEVSGGDALTMRGLATRLGVAPTTLYWHVGHRDELVLAVVRRQAERQAGAEIHGSTAADRIHEATANIWRNALASRNVTALASQSGATTLLELPLEVALVAELEAAGLRGRPARDALRSLLACVAGFLVLAWREDDQLPEELRTASLWEAVEAPGMSDETRAALCRPDDERVETMFSATIRSVIETILAAAATNDGEVAS